MAHHEIEIRLVGGHATPQLPSTSGDMHVGDTVKYFSNDGIARVVFEGSEGSPFGNRKPDTIRDSEIRRVARDGTFFCKCFVTPFEIGWFEGESPQSGGDHEVKPGPNPSSVVSSEDK